MKVWKNADGISPGQGKYAVNISKRFRMMDCKAMTTPMESNLKSLSDSSLESVDATIVSSDDWVLDVHDEYKTIYFIFHEHIELVPNKSKTCSPTCCKSIF